MKKSLIIAVSALVLCACTQNDGLDVIRAPRRTFNVYANADDTRTVFDQANSKAVWGANEMVALAAAKSGTPTDATLQPFSISNAGNSATVSSAEFTGSLTDAGAGSYTYYAVAPYTANVAATDLTAVSLTLPTEQKPTAGSWDSDADLLVAKPVTETASAVGGSGVNFRFAHIGAILKLTFDNSWITLYGTERVLRVTVISNKEIAGAFSLDMTSENPTTSATGFASKSVTLDYTDQNITFADLTAYAIVAPVDNASLTVTVELGAHSFSCIRENVTLSQSRMAHATMSKKAADIVTNNDVEFLKALVAGHMLYDGNAGVDKTPTMNESDWNSNATIKSKFGGLMGLNYDSGEIRITSMDGTPLSGFPEKLHLNYLTAIVISNKSSSLADKTLSPDWYTPALTKFRVENSKIGGAVPEGLMKSPLITMMRLAGSRFSSMPKVVDLPLLTEFTFDPISASDWNNTAFDMTVWNTPKLATDVRTLFAHYPTELFGSGMTATLDYPDTYTGALPMILNLPNVTRVDMANKSAKLSGTDIPIEVNAPNLTFFSVYNCRLKGILPSGIMNSSKLTKLYLGYNGFTGLPETIDLPLVDDMNTQGSTFSGPMPRTVNMPALVKDINNSNGIDFNASGFTTMPEVFTVGATGTIAFARTVTGPLPTTWSTPNATTIEITYNTNITGGIPAGMVNNASGVALVKLNLNRCTSMSGELPATWNTPNLEYICLSKIPFTGAIPASFASTSVKLREMYFDGCDFYGALPHTWASTGIQAVQWEGGNSGLGYMIPASFDVVMNKIIDGGDPTVAANYREGGVATNAWLNECKDYVQFKIGSSNAANWVGFENGWGQARYVKYGAGTTSDISTWNTHRLFGDEKYWTSCSQVPTVLNVWSQTAADAYTSACKSARGL